MKTGETKLGFVQHGLASSHGFEYEKVSSGSKPPGMEIGFISDDVAAAFQKAIDAGAKPLQEPKLNHGVKLYPMSKIATALSLRFALLCEWAEGATLGNLTSDGRSGMLSLMA